MFLPRFCCTILVAVVFMAGLTGCPSSVEVPDIVGLSQSEAEAAIDQSVFFVGEIGFEFSDTVAGGFVISQSPAGGSFAETFSDVNFIVSLGPEGAGEGEGEGEGDGEGEFTKVA